MLISMNGQVLGDIVQSVKKYPMLGLVSSDAPNGLMAQRNLVSHLSSPVLVQLVFLNGSSSQHTGITLAHSAHSPVGLV